jgi:hypothetical protein
VDQRRREQEGDGVRWCAHQSRASGHSVAQELTGKGGKWRAEHSGLISGLTEARVAVWWPGNDDEATAVEKLGGGGAQASREGGNKGVVR